MTQNKIQALTLTQAFFLLFLFGPVLLLLRLTSLGFLQGGMNSADPAINQSKETLVSNSEQIVLALIPPARNHTRDLIAIEQSDRSQCLIESRQKVGTQHHERFCCGQVVQVVLMVAPPVLEGHVQTLFLGLHRGLFQQESFDVAPLTDRWYKVVVMLIALTKNCACGQAMRHEQFRLCFYFGFGNAAVEM